MILGAVISAKQELSIVTSDWLHAFSDFEQDDKLRNGQ